jgi:hypothetical protein
MKRLLFTLLMTSVLAIADAYTGLETVIKNSEK